MTENNGMIHIQRRTGSSEAEVAYWSRLFGVAPERPRLTLGPLLARLPAKQPGQEVIGTLDKEEETHPQQSD